MKWNVEGKTYRLATREEVAALLKIEGAPHVTYGCLCGHGWWTSKNLAMNPDGRYNGCRNIFYIPWTEPECKCPGTNLRCIVEEGA